MKACLTVLGLCAISWLFQAWAVEPTEAERKLLSDLRAFAEKGDAAAQNDLGWAFSEGLFGLKKDSAEGVKWIRIAAEQGLAVAQLNLGVRLEYGDGVVASAGEAVNWYRKAAEAGLAEAQGRLAQCYLDGMGVVQDAAKGIEWLSKAAVQGNAEAQNNLGTCFGTGTGVSKDVEKGVEWLRKSAEQGLAVAQHNLGASYAKGEGVPKNEQEAVKWYHKAAEQGDAGAELSIGLCFAQGKGVAKDYVVGYKWLNLSAAQANEYARRNLKVLESLMTRDQIAEAQKLTSEFRPKQLPSTGRDASRSAIAQSRPDASGTGFFITDDGYFITNQHVAGEGATVRLVTAAGLIAAKVVKVDKANDLALLKADGKFSALPVATSRAVRLGSTVATVGFPNIGLQGFAPKLAKGEIASLAGAQDDARHFQISAPIQPGNSGGALVDERGNVIGVVVAKLSQQAALATSGTLAENVNYAVKSSYLLSFLESVPAVAAQLKEPNTKSRPFEDVVKDVEQATVLVLVY